MCEGQDKVHLLLDMIAVWLLCYVTPGTKPSDVGFFKYQFLIFFNKTVGLWSHTADFSYSWFILKNNILRT